MNDFSKDVVYAIRSLRKSPGFAVPAVVILALGIGANTAIFSIVNTVLLKPLPFPNSDAIVTIFHVPPQQAFPGIPLFSVSAANYLDWRKQSSSFESMALIGFRSFRLGGGARPQSVVAAVTEPGFFQALQVRPEAGREFTAEECQAGRDDVVVLSHAFAESNFGAPGDAVGQKLQLSGRAYSVIGVMPRWLQFKAWFPAAADAWVPIAWTPEEAAGRGNHNYLVVGRLRDGVPVNRAQAEMNVISERLARDHPEEDKEWGAAVFTLRDHLVGDVRPALLTLFGAVGFVLLIACANTANLVLARTITRRKELAIRVAMGAKGGQVVRPILLETSLLAVGGGAVGLLFAHSGQILVLRALADQMPRATEIRVDGQVLAFTFLVSILTGLAAGAIAAWRLMQDDLNDSLKLGLGKTAAYAGSRRTRTALVVAEVALSVILLVGAGLMIRSLWALRSVDPGFEPSGLITMSIPIPKSTDSAHRNRLYDEFLPQLRRLPGVVSAAAIDNLPLSGGGSQQPVVIEGRPAEVFALQPNVSVRRVTPGYLKTLGIRLAAGRDFDEADTTGRKAFVLISQSMARQFWPGENPVGKRLRISFTPAVVREVAGVVGDIKERGLDVLEPVSMMYVPLQQDDRTEVSLVVRAERAPSSLVPAITAVLRQIDPELPVRDVMAMDDLVSASLSQHRFSMLLFAAMAGLAFLLAAVGIYSVLAYNVRSRVHEIGIRMALGAQIRDVLRLIVAEGMKPALAGLALGVFGAWALSGILARLVYGVSPTDPVTFAGVAALLFAVAFLASLIPAYRASRIEPVTALRDE